MLPCARRNVIEQIDRQGGKTEVFRCAHVDCERFTAVVDEAACAGCVMRVPSNRLVACSVNDGPKDFGEPLFENGRLVYPRNGGWEPPKTPYGYKRSEDDQWAFEPLWQPCVDRELHSRKLPCGCLQISAICANPASGREGRLVVLADCEGCLVRRPFSAEKLS